MHRNTWDKHPLLNQSLVVPEFIYGMMSPTSPTRHKDLIWHTYSAQAFGQFAGDLDFYFGGFDYRNKVQDIDTSKTPVAMMTGAFDVVCAACVVCVADFATVVSPRAVPRHGQEDQRVHDR